MVLLLTLLFACSPAALAQSPPASEVAPDTALQGRVIDATTRTPLQDFTLALQPGVAALQLDRPLGHTQVREFTAEDGRFRWAGASPGIWTVVALAPGYQRRYVTDIEIAAGSTTAEIVIPLERGATLQGRVVDEASGRPIANALVTLQTPARPDIFALLRPEARTDRDGAFELDGLAPGRSMLWVRARGYSGVIRDVGAKEQPSVTLALRRHAVIAGLALGSNGITPTPAMVHLRSPSGLLTSRPTDVIGRFVFDQSIDGSSYEISASTGSTRSITQQLRIEQGQQLRNLELILRPAATIRGNITGIAQNEMSNVNIATLHLDATLRDVLDPISLLLITGDHQLDPQGSYRVDTVEAGATMVIATVNQKLQISKRVEVPEKGELRVDFDFAGASHIGGRVTRAGRPVAGLVVIASAVGAPGTGGSATTSETGEYVLGALPAGDYRVHPFQFEPVRISLAGPAVQNFELPPLALSGLVIDAATRQPVPNAVVGLHALASGSTRNTGSDREGKFALIGLNAGEYLLTVHGPGYDVSRQRITLKQDQLEPVLPLKRTKGVALQIDTTGHEPMSGVNIAMLSGTAETLRFRLLIDENGIVRLPPSLAGQTFKITAEYHAPALITAWDGAPLNVVLQSEEQPPR
jgi:hypothetical protein